MSNKELQAEELEVLQSIYDGDEAFKQLSENVFQYKFGEHEHIKSFLLELKWGENYPKEKPIVNMDTFYNRNLYVTKSHKRLDTQKTHKGNKSKMKNVWNVCGLNSINYIPIDVVKNKVIDLISQEAEQYLGEAMTYSLIECVKEKYESLVEEQPDSIAKIEENIEKLAINKEVDISNKKAPKKEQLTKAQKRRQWDKVESKGEKPRGWDWVDIVKHLSQTGGKETVNELTT